MILQSTLLILLTLWQNSVMSESVSNSLCDVACPLATKDKEIKLIAKGWERTCRIHTGDCVTRHSVLDLLTFPWTVAYLPIAHNGTYHVRLCDADIAGPKHLQLLRSNLGNDWAFQVFSKVLFKSFFSFPLPGVVWDIPDEFRSLQRILL